MISDKFRIAKVSSVGRRVLGSSVMAKRRRGFALVVVLASIVLVCIITVAFISQAMLDRKVSYSSAGSHRADSIAHLALEATIGDLNAEIQAGSTSHVVDGVTIYIPLTNSAIVPNRVGDGNLPNIVKRSVGGGKFWNDLSYRAVVPNPVRAYLTNSTLNPSANKRFIKAERWNAPLLMGATVPGGFVSPDWILVTRQGPMTNASGVPDIATLSDAKPANLNYVLGRYAYVVYDEGGLLDINVAGHPAGMSADFTARRGGLPQVSLGEILGVLNEAAIVKWRNSASAITEDIYAEYALSSTNGFLNVAGGNQAFVSRQDLIKYAKSNPTHLEPSALQYLGTFTRELDAPSYTPPLLSSSVNSQRKPVQSGYPASGFDDEFNPSTINTRVVSGKEFTRLDGTTALAGEPLLKHRFSLTLLSLVTRSAIANTQSPIYRYFGLTRASASDEWVYNHGGAGRIMTLGEVAQAGREPDFFELLQAGIFVGSLGQKALDTFAIHSTLDKDVAAQIIQIGANIIDQYDNDAYPTRIEVGGQEIYGIENLPYLSRVLQVAMQLPSGQQGFWYQPEIWNPQTSSTSSIDRPTRFRFISSGSVQCYVTDTGTYDTTPFAQLSSPGIQFSSTSPTDFSMPGILTPSRVDLSLMAAVDKFTDGLGTSFVGINLHTWMANPLLGIGGGVRTQNVSGMTGVTHRLEYQDEAGNWIPYSQMRNIVAGGDLYMPNPAKGYYDPTRYVYGGHVDPRTDRFGAFFGAVERINSTPPFTNNPTIRPTEGVGELAVQALVSTTTGDSLQYGLFSDNKESSASRWADPDSIVRRADGAYTDGNVERGGYPLAMDAFSVQNSRPVILNRSFRSVGELGYAFRGAPWKHLDFFTSESADAALLDLFTVALPRQDQIVAGRVNINTRQAPVLAAIFAGAIKADENVMDQIQDGMSLAQSLTSFTAGTNSGSPLLNRSELATRWIGNTGNLAANSADTIIKRRRESAVRALADVGNTRTWNLMIDVIAQSGRFPSKAGSIDKFMVEGECRYWLHVAIDRYTGKVISESIEAVYE